MGGLSGLGAVFQFPLEEAVGLIPLVSFYSVILALYALLVFRNRLFARFLFDPDEPSHMPRGAVTAGIAVLGAYFVMNGLASMGGFAFAALGLPERYQGVPISNAVWGVLQVFFGAGLYRYPRALASLAKLDESERAA